MWCLIFFLIFFLSNKAAFGIEPFYGFDTHPNFWIVDNYTITGKKYLNLSQNSSFNTKWVWSQPYQKDPSYRILVYQYYQNDQAAHVDEWELWFGDAINHQAINHSYGGQTEQLTRGAYLNQEYCVKKQAGYNWPNINNDTRFSFTTQSLNNNQQQCTHTGYIATHMYETWDTAFSDLRIKKCDEYIPSTISVKGNQICKSSPNVAPVYQRYAAGNSLDQTASFYLGCEATVYAWGYSFSSNKNYQNWFRNGELRWSEYLGFGNYYNSDVLPAPDDHDWWNQRCSKAWTEKDNWIYSGNYKLDNKIFIDVGDPKPSPTATNTPKPTSTLTPTRIPSITPTTPPVSLCTQCPGKPGAKSKGDADCSGIININDVSIWRSEFISSNLGTVNKNNWQADFDCNGKVNLNDISIWRDNFIKSL